jgi:hypothetical protein
MPSPERRDGPSARGSAIRKKPLAEVVRHGSPLGRFKENAIYVRFRDWPVSAQPHDRRILHCIVY